MDPAYVALALYTVIIIVLVRSFPQRVSPVQEPHNMIDSGRRGQSDGAATVAGHSARVDPKPRPSINRTFSRDAE